MKNQFYKTKEQFMTVLNSDTYSFKHWCEWMLIPEELKAAALYVRFYDQMTLAWEKTKKPFIEEETAVSTLLQYIIKNVPILAKNPGRFTEAYMYQISFNAFYPLGRIKRDIAEYEHRVSPYEIVDECRVELDSYENFTYADSQFIDLRADTTDVFDIINNQHFWDLIEDMDVATKDIVEHLINGTRICNPLIKKKEAAINELRIKLKDFNPYE